MEETTEKQTNEPPLPTMWRAGNNAKETPPRSAENAWRSLVDIAPMHAERINYAMGPYVGLPAALRSPFRTGEIQFVETGMRVRGMEVRIPKWLQWVSMFGGLLFYALSGISRSLRGSGPMAALIVYGTIIFLVLLVVVLGMIYERRRFAIEQEIPWQNVHALLVDKNLKWLTLVLKVDPAKPKQKPTYQFLSLNRLEPAMTAQIADTVSYFAPQAIRKTTAFGEWTVGTKVATIVGVLVIFGALTFLLLLIFRKIP